MTFEQAEREFVNYLKSVYQEKEAGNLFFLTVRHLFNWDKARYLLHKQDQVGEADAKKLESVKLDLLSGMPVQYILGETEFHGLVFKVNPSVLIPRPETEELVQWILDSAIKPDPVIMDIGTGSGCIAIALKHNLPLAELIAVDISEMALNTAGMNAALNQTPVQFVQQDILDPTFEGFPGKFDVMVSNPPYVTESERSLMHKNVLEHEPHTALFVPDDDPLVFYDRIADLALKQLNTGGFLFFEINEKLSQRTISILVDRGFKQIECRKDLFGKDRMIRASL